MPSGFRKTHSSNNTLTLMCAGTALDLSSTRVMGILNVTPDSFADGGLHYPRRAALARAREMVDAGVDIIDVGGESTRPGAQPVPVDEELERVIPVIEEIVTRLHVPVSVDTSKSEVMQAALDAGASMINDVKALRAPGALQVAAGTGACVCLMHMQGEPRTMQQAPVYGDVVAEIKGFLAERIEACVQARIPRERLVIDPGFGFGKTLEHNLLLLRRLHEQTELGLPVLVGLSRKSMIGRLLDDAPADQRLWGSLAAATLASWLGAAIVRVHDVRATVEALRVCNAVRGAGISAVK